MRNTELQNMQLLYAQTQLCSRSFVREDRRRWLRSQRPGGHAFPEACGRSVEPLNPRGCTGNHLELLSKAHESKSDGELQDAASLAAHPRARLPNFRRCLRPAQGQPQMCTAVSNDNHRDSADRRDTPEAPPGLCVP